MLSAEKIESTYGVSITSSELQILMQHRALLFGLIGSTVWCSLIFTTIQTATLTLAGFSMFGFIVIALVVGDYNSNIQQIVRADVVGLVILASAIVGKTLNSKS